MDNPWMYEGRPFTEAPKDKIGFIYSILCVPNGREYIGSKHFQVKGIDNWQNYYGSPSSPDFKNDLAFHAENSFVRTILFFHATAEELAAAETSLQTNLDVLHALLPDGVTQRYYNLCVYPEQFLPTPEGTAKRVAKMRNRKRPVEVMRRLHEGNVGSRRTKETRQKMSEARRGWTPEQKETARQAQIGRRQTQQSIEKNRLAKLRFAYTLARPDGTLLEIRNMKAFCRNSGFNGSKNLDTSFRLNRPVSRGKDKGWQLISKTPIAKVTPLR